MRHQLVRLLGCGIQTHGMSDTRFLRERHIRIQTIHAARAGIHQMTHLMVPASLQHIDKTIQVRFHVRIWIRDRITYACLGGQIHHRIEPLVGEKHPHRLPFIRIKRYLSYVWLGVNLYQSTSSSRMPAPSSDHTSRPYHNIH